MRVKLVTLVVSLCVVLFFPFSVFAQTNTHQNIILPKSQTINNNYFAAGSSVDVEGTVNGDAYLAGGTILMNGTVHGDVLAAGGQITIRGTAQNVRVAGGQIVIDGKVNGNVTVAGGSVTITNGSQIAGSIVGVGGQVLLSGPVGKTANLGGGQLTIGNSIGGDVSAMEQQLTLNNDAKINGNLWYQSPQKAQVDSGAMVTGKTTYVLAQKPQKELHPGALAGFGLLLSLASLILEIIIGLVILALLPMYSRRVIDFTKKHIWLSLGIGVLIWIVSPFIVLLLLITLIGIPLALVYIFVIIIFSYIGKIFAALFFGNWIFERTNQKKINLYWAFIAGIIVLEIIMWIPIVGWIVAAFLGAVGLGTVLILEKEYYFELRAKKLF